MIWFLATLLLVVSVSSTTVEEAQLEDGQDREAKILPIFQVVKFPVSLPEIPKHSSLLYWLFQSALGLICIPIDQIS